ncbi:hypothetical protein ACLIA0_14235 [Bacillaceae bacterium W0354]
MLTSLIIITLTVFLTFLVLYAAEKIISIFRSKNSTLKLDQVTKGMDLELGHR